MAMLNNQAMGSWDLMAQALEDHNGLRGENRRRNRRRGFCRATKNATVEAWKVASPQHEGCGDWWSWWSCRIL